MGLEEVKEWLHYCGRCNSCNYIYRDYRNSCPSVTKFFFEPYTCGGKIWMALDLYQGRYDWSPSIVDKIFSCTLCGNCTVQCQQEAGKHALEIFEALRAENIGVNVHYLPLHLHPFYQRRFGYKKGDYPIAESCYERAITLPIFPKMTGNDIQDVIKAVKKVIAHCSNIHLGA